MNEMALRNTISGDRLRSPHWSSRLGYAGLWFLLGALSLLYCMVPAAFGEQTPIFLNEPLHLKHRVIPLQGVDAQAIQAQVVAGVTIPLWSGSTVSEGATYHFFMVGKPPYQASVNETTSVKAPIVNIAFQFADGTVLDPTAGDSVCSPAGSPYSLTLASPLFKTHSYTWGGTYVGTTQYVDAFQRANFWAYTRPGSISPSYHVLLGATQNWIIRVTVPSTEGFTKAAPCGRLGVVTFNFWDNVLASVFPALNNVGVNSATFPIFLFHNVILVDPSTGEAADGYHGAFLDQYGYVQTYAVAEYDTTRISSATKDVSPLSHEIAEWVNDPLGNNLTPPWGHTGQVSGCQGNLEVGDPMSGSITSVTMPNGFSYHTQQLAFFSWFYRGIPSMGVNGWYSNLGTFTSPPPPCY